MVDHMNSESSPDLGDGGTGASQKLKGRHSAESGGSSGTSGSGDGDEHNDLCEVCDSGGDLLCCDTCSLVFHLRCIRPKLTAVPRGDWSCAHCVLDVSHN